MCVWWFHYQRIWKKITRTIREEIEYKRGCLSLFRAENVEIVTKNPFEDMMKVRNAGAIFIGEHSSEPLGDYFAGPNHVLPTNGTAKFFSALSVDDFIKKSSIVYYSREALRKIHKDIIQFATSEQLTAHANSIAVRFEERIRRTNNGKRSTDRKKHKRNTDPSAAEY